MLFWFQSQLSKLILKSALPWVWHFFSLKCNFEQFVFTAQTIVLSFRCLLSSKLYVKQYVSLLFNSWKSMLLTKLELLCYFDIVFIDCPSKHLSQIYKDIHTYFMSRPVYTKCFTLKCRNSDFFWARESSRKRMLLQFLSRWFAIWTGFKNL